MISNADLTKFQHSDQLPISISQNNPFNKFDWISNQPPRLLRSCQFHSFQDYIKKDQTYHLTYEGHQASSIPISNNLN